MNSPSPTSGNLEARSRQFRHGGRSGDLAILLIALLIPLMGALLVVVDSGRHVAFAFHKEWQLPDVCMSRVCFNWECPGCGLTRSVVHIMHGRWEASLASHRVGWLIFALIVLQIPYRLWRLGRNRLHSTVPQPSAQMTVKNKSNPISKLTRAGSEAEAVA